jgi:D-beta-D-heptose 7-phosphate kinase/D-beta-D-heptose 1-phosphate adenosyltransferase
VKLRVLSRNQQLLRADFESAPDRAALDGLMHSFSQLVNEHDAIIFSDYGKGTLADIESLIGIARQESRLTLVDPKGSDFQKYTGATMITPNLDELKLVAGPISTDRDLKQKAERVIEECELDKLLVTLSDKGMTLFEKGQPETHISARTREVYDVSGAGDTVIAVMAMTMAAGLGSQAGVKIANSAAGIVISKLGTATADIDELQQAVLEDSK